MLTIFLFAHQDDEVFVFPALVDELRHKNIVHCFFLTNGSYHSLSPSIRNKESREALESIGVPLENIHFLGTEMNVDDGRLFESAKDVLEYLSDWMRHRSVDKIYVTAWEGGHQDHDFAFVMAKELKRRYGIPQVLQFYLYNGEYSVWKFFRVMKPLRNARPAQFFPLEFKVRWLTFWTIFKYKSQLRTWVALAPELVMKLFLKRHFVVYQVDQIQVLSRRPLYERMGRCKSQVLKMKIDELGWSEGDL